MNDSSQRAQRPIRAGIVGAGLMGRWHAHALSRAGGQLVAVADINLAAAQQLARVYRAHAFSSLIELLGQIEIDVLHICTPLDTHVELGTAALEGGVHVLVEKPLAPDADRTSMLLAQARAHGRMLIPVHQFVFQDGIHLALTRLTDIAPLVQLDFTAATAGAEGADDSGRDQLVADVLPHALSLFQRFLPDGLDGVQWVVQHPAPGELRALAQAQHISLSITLSTRARPTRNTFTLMGTRGTIQADLYHGFAVFESGDVSRVAHAAGRVRGVSRTQKVLHPFGLSLRTLSAAALNLARRALRNEPAYPGLRPLIRAFYLAVRDGVPPPFSAQEILDIARARDRLISNCRLQIADL